MKILHQYCESVGLTHLFRGGRGLLAVAMLVLALVPVSSALAQNDRREQREAIQQANRERWMQRQQEMQERNQQREPLQWQRRNQLGIPQQFEPIAPEGGPDHWRDRAGRMTREERQALRRQIQEAGRSVYSAPPPPNK